MINRAGLVLHHDQEPIMRSSTAFCAGLLLGSMLGVADSPAATPKSLEDRLAALDYTVGKEAGEIADFQIKERVYLDSRHLVVPGGSSRAYLVTLQERCHGLASNRVMAWTHTRHHLVRGDVLAPTHEGRRVDECKIERIQELDSK
jgi:hypothetical protein